MAQRRQLIRGLQHRSSPTFHHVLAILLQALHRRFQGMNPTQQFDGIWQGRFAVPRLERERMDGT